MTNVVQICLIVMKGPLMGKQNTTTNWFDDPYWETASLEEIIQIVRTETLDPLKNAEMWCRLLSTKRLGDLNEDQIRAVEYLSKYITGTDMLIEEAFGLVKKQRSNSLKNSKDDD